MRWRWCSSLAALAAGCESTQSKSAELKANAKGALDEGKGLVVKKQNPDVKVLATSTLKDKNGEAVVVRMRNVGQAPLANVPISVRLADKGGKAVYTNTQPGLEPALAHVALLQPGQELFWVNDQVVSSGKPAAGARRSSARRSRSPARAPRIEVKGVRARERPGRRGSPPRAASSTTPSVLQRRLPVFCVARQRRRGRRGRAGRSSRRSSPASPPPSRSSSSAIRGTRG